MTHLAHLIGAAVISLGGVAAMAVMIADTRRYWRRALDALCAMDTKGVWK